MRTAMRANPSWPRGWPICGRWSVTSTRNWPGARRGTQSHRVARSQTESAPPDGRLWKQRLSCGERTPVENAVENTAKGCGLRAGDLEVDRGGHLGVQPDLDAVRARGLDRVRHHDGALVDLRAARFLQRSRDVGRAHRAEEAAVRAGPPLDPDGQLLQPAGHRLGVFHGADLAGRAGPLDQVNLLLPTAGPGDPEPARHQVVPAIA